MCFDIRIAGHLSDQDGGGEERFLEHVKAALPDDYIVILGATFAAGPEDRRNQVDALIVGPPGLFIVDVKNWAGRWEGDAKTWYRYGSTARRDSPLDKITHKWEHFRKWLEHNTEPVLSDIHKSNVWIDYGIVLTHTTCDTTEVLDPCKLKYLIALRDFAAQRLELRYRTASSKRLNGYLECRLIADKICPSRECDILAIDFGTSYSSIATYPPGYQAVIFRDKFNNNLIPTVFGYQNNKTYTGQVAKNALNTGQLMYRNYVASIKTYLGMAGDEYELFKSENKPGNSRFTKDGLVIRLDGKAFLAVDIAASIMRELRELANHRSGYPWNQAVVSVPARSGQQYRALIKEAAKRAGFSVVFLVDEPTAAALAYGLVHKYEGCIAVFDMGGGTFDFSIIEVHSGRCQELVKLGALIGGDDFDRRIYEDFVSAMRQSDVLDVNTALKDRQRYRLFEAARHLKETLSGQDECRIFLEAWHNGRDALKDYHRDVFNVLIADRVADAIAVCQRAINEVRDVKINDVVLVGGSTLIPLVQQKAGEFFGLKPKSDIDPNLAVVQGVALRAGMYMGRVSGSYLMTRVSEVTVGTEALQIIVALDTETLSLSFPEVADGCYDDRLLLGIGRLRVELRSPADRFQIEHILRTVGLDFEAIESDRWIIYVTTYRIVDPIIIRNNRIEEDGKIKTYEKAFRTSQDNETRMLLQIYEIPPRFRAWAKADDAKKLLGKEIMLQKAAPAQTNGFVLRLRFDRDGRVEIEYEELLESRNRDIIVIDLIYNA